MKKVIIIGATSGIGKALATRYLKAGHLVGITGRRTHSLDEIKHHYPQQTFTEAFDVTGNENIVHLEKLIEQLQGMDLFISSISAYRGNSWAPAYGASKAYMSNYMEALSIKAYRMKLPVYITDIQPGFVLTDMAKGNKLFWMAPLEKATTQMFETIEKKKRRVQITKLGDSGMGVKMASLFPP